jgi:hypothetical protein
MPPSNCRSLITFKYGGCCATNAVSQARRAFATHAATVAEVKTAIEQDTKESTWKAFVDFKYIKENAEAVQANAIARKANCDVAKVRANAPKAEAVVAQRPILCATILRYTLPAANESNASCIC